MARSDDLDELLRPQPLESLRSAALDLVLRWRIALGVAALVLVGALVMLRPQGPATGAVTFPVATSTPASTPVSAEVEPGVTASAPSSAPPTTAVGLAVVHVAGAVHAPGVVRLDTAARVSDALVAAGGHRGDADLDRINLAAPLSDAMRIYVPTLGEADTPIEVAPTGAAPSSGASTSPSGDATAPPGPININSATPEQLQELPGVGPATAAAIVSHREKSGPFASVESLDDVRGIGPAKVEALRDLVVTG